MQKSFLLIVCLPLFFSCGKSSDSNDATAENIFKDLSYAVDTVVVDPGEELINLSSELYFSDITRDAKSLYLYSQSDHSLTGIDLDQLSVSKKIFFEKEGPNGTGAYISEIKVLPREKFMFSTFESSGIFDAQSVKLEDITLKAIDYPELNAEERHNLNFQINASEDGHYLYSLPGGLIEVDRNFAVIDRSNGSGKMIDIPEMDNTGRFSTIFINNGMVYLSQERYFLDEYHSILYLSSSVTSDLYRYNFEKDSLQLLTFPITVSPREKTEFPKTEVSSNEEHQEETRKVNSQVAFKNLMWDESRKLFFRIGSITKPSDLPDALAKIDVFLHAFDSSMKLVEETWIEDLRYIPEYPFFKDGKLWSYVNVEDELGFAVFTFNF